MSNVLPFEDRARIWRMYRDRFIVAGSCVAVFAAIVFALALLPSAFTLNPERAAAPSSGATATAADRANLASAQTLLNAFAPLVDASTTPSQAIEEALALRSAGVSINHITYVSGKPSQITLTGSAKEPQQIETYRAAIASSTLFSGVSVPVDDLIGAQNGEFTMTLSGTF